MFEMSRLSTKYIPLQVSFTVAGQPVDPTADVVQMAFMPGSALPGPGDWHTASWESAGGTYYAQCLVGPAGGVTLAPGVWNIWLKVTDAPEVPVDPVAQLAIT